MVYLNVNKTLDVHQVEMFYERTCFNVVVVFATLRGKQRLLLCPSIHPDLRSNIYCYAVAAGGEKEWNFAWEMSQSNSSETEQVFRALSCTTQVSLLKR